MNERSCGRPGSDPPRHQPANGWTSTRRQSSHFVVLCYCSPRKLIHHRCLNLVATLWKSFSVQRQRQPWLWSGGSLHAMSPSCFLKGFLLKEKWDRECIFRMRNLEKWYGWTYLQGRNRAAEAENRRAEVGEGGLNWESITDTYATVYRKES